jgi:hypothetical protein
LDTGSWNNATKFIAYGDRLYLLDPANNQIWRYRTVPEGYTQVAAYFDSSLGVSLEGATDFAIDGNVFVLMPGNVIKKFSGGEDTNFTLGAVPNPYPALGTISQIYADSNAKYLYVLDAANRRVVAFDKEGTYMAQYIYDNIENPADLFVDEAGGFIYLSAGTQVYRLPVK